MSLPLLRLVLWLQSKVAALRTDERGQGLVEYALIIALIAILVIGAVIGLKNQIVGIFNQVANCLQNASVCA